MPTSNYCRLGGALGLVAGLVRLLLVFAPATRLAIPLRETVYMAVDFGILFGVTAFYLRYAQRLPFLGLAGLLITVAGVMAIRTGDRSLFGASAYTQGSSMVAVGCALLGLQLPRRGRLGGLTAGLWLASPVVGVVGAALGVGPWTMSLAAGLFGLGLAAAGLASLSMPTDQPALNPRA